MNEEGLTEETTKKILEAIQNDKKIEAIKLYRESTGCGLKEAKDYVDHLWAEQVKERPEMYQSKGNGCLGVFILTAFVPFFCLILYKIA